MSPLKEFFLTLPEVEGHIRAFEAQYGITTLQFFRDPTAREQVSEDDAFEWEAYVDHRRELRLADDDVRRAYIKGLSRVPEAEVAEIPTPNSQLAFAA